MRNAAIWLALLACGGGDIEPTDPHALDVCDASWGPNFEGEACEFACRSMPADNDETCSTTFPDGSPAECSSVHESLGVRGCCGTNLTEDRVFFAECE